MESLNHFIDNDNVLLDDYLRSYSNQIVLDSERLFVRELNFPTSKSLCNKYLINYLL